MILCLEFKLKKIVTNDGHYEHVQDMFINNMIYRPAELEHMNLYDMMMHYELKKLGQKKIKEGKTNVESKVTFNVMQEHPSYKYMVVTKRKTIIIPCINSINLLPNVADLHLNCVSLASSTLESRETYAMIALLLFSPYRIQDDLKVDDSYWKKYNQLVSHKIISDKSLKILQNIQDASHNVSKLKSAKDDLLNTTIYTSHEDDNKREYNSNEDTTINIKDIAELFQQFDDMGIRYIDPKKRSLSILCNRHNIISQDIPLELTCINDITNIPNHIKKEISLEDSDINEYCSDDSTINTKNKLSNGMIIDILIDDILSKLPLNSSIDHNESLDPTKYTISLSFQNIIIKYKLDFKQSVAFEIMASSFILKSLKVEKVTDEKIHMLSSKNNMQTYNTKNSLANVKKALKKKGGKEKLIMFLSGMGGTGKSEVIKSFVYFATSISHYFGWNYDCDTIKITAMTGAAACQLPNGKNITQYCISYKYKTYCTK